MLWQSFLVYFDKLIWTILGVLTLPLINWVWNSFYRKTIVSTICNNIWFYVHHCYLVINKFANYIVFYNFILSIGMNSLYNLSKYFILSIFSGNLLRAFFFILFFFLPRFWLPIISDYRPADGSRGARPVRRAARAFFRHRVAHDRRGRRITYRDRGGWTRPV